MQNRKNRETAAIRRDLERGSLGSALEKTYELSLAAGSDEVARWSRLELEGYYRSNPAMRENVTLPEYRTVPGQYYDLYGRVFLPPGNCDFINETRLPFGVAELERLAASREQVSLQDPSLIAMLREHLAVEVHMFRFSVVHLDSVLTAIRLELLTRLASITPAQDPFGVAATREDVLLLQPNFQGIRLDLRALWRRFRSPT